MSKSRKKNKQQIAKQDKAAQKKFFTITIIVTIVLMVLIYSVFRSIT